MFCGMIESEMRFGKENPMNQNMFAALLFAMLAGMHPEEPAPEDGKPQSSLQTAGAESEQAAAPIDT